MRGEWGWEWVLRRQMLCEEGWCGVQWAAGRMWGVPVRGVLVVAWKVAMDVWCVQALLVETTPKWVRLSEGWQER